MGKFRFEAGERKYSDLNALTLAICSRTAYQTKRSIEKTALKTWELSGVKFLDQQESQAFVGANEEVVVVAFRGTEPKILYDWLTDVECRFVPGPFGKVHRGFWTALNHVWLGVTAAVKRFRKNGQSLWFTGHSLGGALASLAAARLVEEGKEVAGLYTYGQPRVGDKAFADRFDASFKAAFRVVNSQDIVTRVPPRFMNYSHIGTPIFFDRRGKLHKGAAWWRIFLDRYTEMAADALTRYDFLWKHLPGWVDDHRIQHYIRNLRKEL